MQNYIFSDLKLLKIVLYFYGIIRKFPNTYFINFKYEESISPR